MNPNILNKGEVNAVERRKFRRVDFRVKAEIVYGGVSYTGFIENFSETGIFKIVFPEEKVIDLIPGTMLQIKFQTPSENDISLNCEVKWLRINTDSPFVLKYNMGMSIINPPRKYREFISRLLLNPDLQETPYTTG